MARATSTSTGRAWAPSPVHSDATASAACRRLSATASRAPSRANSSALARPMPEPPPVMMHTLSLSRIAISSPGVLDPAHDVLGDGDQRAVLLDHLDVGARLPLDRIDFGDRVGERDRVAD